MPDRPDDWDEWVAEAESGGAVPYEAIEWLRDNEPEWYALTDVPGINPESAIQGIEHDIDPSEISHITIGADGDNWYVVVDGVRFEVDEAIVWDWADIADYEDDAEYDKDIHTPGGAE